MKQNYEDNKETISAQMKQQYHQKKDIRTCVCGGKYDYGNSSNGNKHYSSNKHTEFVETFYNNLQELMCQ